MTFLQPFILWGLPLILLPVLIHFINRMRHRSQPWAAMRFLLSATRASVSHAKLRQFLILLFRVLAVLTLILFLSRPLAGGWLGWALSPAPDAILILLDRSASMETQIAAAGITKREQALKLLVQAAKEFEEASHLVLIDSALRTPQEVAKAANLAELSSTTPTDTAADIPAMLQAALNWLVENRAGTAEIWLASDLQRSNWQADDARWKSFVSKLGSLPQKVRVRLLALNQEPASNTSVSLKEILRRQRGEQGELQFVLDLQRAPIGNEPVPLTMNLDGARSQVELTMDGQALRWRQKAVLANKKSGGWGSFELPADANRRDNTAYFVYGSETPLRASIISTDAESGKFLKLAAGVLAKDAKPMAEMISPADFANLGLDENTLLVWQATLPSGANAERLRSFAEEGGVVIFFPPGRADAQQFSGTGWGEIQSAEGDRGFRIVRWDEEQGPLAKSDEGLSLSLPQVTFQKRQIITGQKNVLAAFDDGVPLLVRQTQGRGEIYFCAALPNQDWSSLGDGPVLVPMLQRLLVAGSRRLQQASSLACGELSVVEQLKKWDSVDAETPKDPRFQAGIYRSGARLLAVNRPASEDEPEVLELDETQRLFGDLPLQMLQERRKQTDVLQGEIWRMILFGMLAFLIVESILVLPARGSGIPTPSGNAMKTPAARKVVATTV